MALEQRWVCDVRKAVDPHVNFLYEFIQHKVRDVRFEVASALGEYSGHSLDSLRILRAALDQEADDETREAMKLSIGKLEGYAD
jgi:hypothetical protein